MEAIEYENPKKLTPDTLHLAILQAVGKKQGCPIRFVVNQY